MTAPFDGGAADLAGVTNEEGLFVDAAVRSANVTVDRKGTEVAAAAMPGTPVSKPPSPVEMTIDRPFLFAVAEREPGTVLFLGGVTDPS